MQTVTESACAKLNLTLEVGAKRPDGYHEVRSVMTSAALCDTVHVAKRQSGIVLDCGGSSLPCDERNLAYRAARAFFDAEGIRGGADITVEKRIPMQAGLGGGSADAAAVLRGLRSLYAPAMTQRQLAQIGAALGSDVPFCVFGGTMLGTGRGEIVTQAPAMKKCVLVIAKPKQAACDTGEMYRAIDSHKPPIKRSTDAMLAALQCGDLQSICSAMNNTFEAILPPKHPSLALRDILLDGGALGAQLSGSGSAVFGIFSAAAAAQRVCDRLQCLCGSEVFLCTVR